MQFETKRALLTYLGKNPDDNKLVDRMIRRWEVYREDGMYHLITNKQSLIEENRELKLRVQELEKSESMTREEHQHLQEFFKIKDELKEAKIQWEYRERMYDEEKADKQNRIRKCYDWIRRQNIRVNYDEFHEWVMSDEQS